MTNVKEMSTTNKIVLINDVMFLYKRNTQNLSYTRKRSPHNMHVFVVVVIFSDLPISDATFTNIPQIIVSGG